MSMPYHSLHITTLGAQGWCVEQDRGFSEVTLHHPALSIMVDFRLTPAVTTQIDDHPETALAKLQASDSSYLLVLSELSEIRGVVPAEALTAHRIAEQHDSTHTPAALTLAHWLPDEPNIEMLSLQEVISARVGDVIYTLHDLGKPIVLVGNEEGDMHQIRGLYSARDIARQLDVPFHYLDKVHTFSALGKRIFPALCYM